MSIQPASHWPATLALLARLHPPRSLVHAGSPPATAPSRAWQQWHVPHAVVIDPLLPPADTAPPTEWLQINAVLGAQAHAATPFYTQSLRPESGLLPPEPLRHLWPNLRTHAIEERPTLPLPQALPAGHPAPNWLLIDTLPALPTLQGAAPLLPGVDVLCTRVVLPTTAPHPELAPCQLHAVEHWLAPLHFRCVGVTETHHPDLAYALFVRDLAPQVQHLRHAQAELQHRLATEASAKIQALQQINEQTQLALLRTAQLQQAQATHAELLQQHEQLAQARQALQADLAQTTQARDAEAQAKQAAQQAQADLQAQLLKAQADNASLVQKQELQAQAQRALRADLTQTTQARDAEAQAKQAAQQAQADLQAQLAKIAADKAELLQKHELLAQTHQALEANLAQAREAASTAQTALPKAQVHITQLDQDKAALAQARDAEAQAKATLQSQLQQAQTAHTELLAKHEQLVQNQPALQAQLQQKDQQIAELQQRLQNLQTEQQETIHRQQLMDEELLKAEAQIELIKDLLLREQQAPSPVHSSPAP